MKKIFTLFAALAMVMSMSAKPYLRGSFNGWGTGNEFQNGECTINLAANTKYEFKVDNNGDWSTSYGGAAITSTKCTDVSCSGSSNATIQTTLKGSYTFKWNASTKKISVVYPTEEVIKPKKDITVKAKMPASWTKTIDAWVWTDEDPNGKAVTPEKDGDWYVITQNTAASYIIFRNGATWNGDANQTVDMCFEDNACIQLAQSGSSKATYTNIDCVSEFTLTATANPAEGGSVTGAGVYEEGTTVNLTATPNEGYEFVSWTNGGAEVSTNATYSFVITANLALVANFKAVEATVYTISIEAVNGTVTGAGVYEEDATVTLTATPADGYNFKNWTVSGAEVSAENPYIFTATADVTVTANFEEIPVEYETVYFVNAQDWEKVCIYTWTPEIGTWPGKEMTKEAEQIGGKDVYSYTIEKGTTFVGLNFNNGNNGKQTGDLTWTAGKYYVIDNWYTKEEAEEKLAVPVPTYDYYVVGTFNSWANPDPNHGMTLVGDVYKATVTLNVGANMLKVTNGTWDNAKGFDAMGAEYEEVSNDTQDGNILITLTEGKDVVVVYNATTGKVTFEGLTEKLPAVITYVLMGVNNDWTTGISLVRNEENTESEEYMLLGQEILAGDAVKVVTLADGKAVAYCGRVDVQSIELLGVTFDENGNVVLAPGKYDFYYKVADDGIYIAGEAYPTTATVTVADPIGSMSTYTGVEYDESAETWSKVYNIGEEVTISVNTVGEGWVFAYWTVGEEKIFTEEYTFTLAEDVTVTATYAMAMDVAFDNLVLDAESGLVEAGPDALYGIELTLGIDMENDHPKGFGLVEGSSISLGGNELELVTGYFTAIDVYAPSAEAVVMAVYEEMLMAFVCSMTAAPAPAYNIVVENAVLTDSIGFLFMNGTWSDGETIYPVQVEIPGLDPTVAEATYTVTVTVGGNGDDEPWLGFGEGEVTVTVNEGVVTLIGHIENAGNGFKADVTISGTLPVVGPELPAASVRAWAYDLALAVEGEQYTFSYKATTAALATLIFTDVDGEELATVELGLVEAGANSVVLAKSELPVGKKVNWAIKLEAGAIAELAEVTDQTRGIYDFYNMMDVLVDNNPESEYFGKIYIQMAYNGASDGATDRADVQTAGLFIYDQELNELNNPSNVGIKPTLPAGYTMGDNRNKFHRLEIDPKTGNLTYCYNISGQPAIFSIDRANLTGEVENLLAGVAGLNQTCAHTFDAEGTLYVMNLASSKGTIYKIIDGQAVAMTETTGKFINASMSLAADGMGGLWVAQNRGQIDTYYQLVHYTAEGAIDFAVYQGNENGFTGSSTRGALAYDVERQLLAQGRNGKVEVYSVAYDAETGVPTLTLVASTPYIATNLDGLHFDYAGDLYVVSSGSEKFYKFAMPTETNVCTTPAASKYAFQNIEYNTMEITMTNLEVAEMGGYLVLTASDEMETGLNVMLALNEDGSVSEMSYASIISGWMETELPIVEGNITKTYSEELATDVYSGLVVVENMGGYLGLQLTMYAAPAAPAVDVVATDANIYYDEYGSLCLSANWNGETLNISGIEVSEEPSFMMIEEIFGEGEEDWYIWMSYDATTTVDGNVLTIAGEFTNNWTGDTYNVTITGTMPQGTATDVDNLNSSVAPVKILKNGQVIIIKNGVQYSVQGQVIK